MRRNPPADHGQPFPALTLTYQAACAFRRVRDMVNELASEINADVVVIGLRNPLSISTYLLDPTPERHPSCPYPAMVVR